MSEIERSLKQKLLDMLELRIRYVDKQTSYSETELRKALSNVADVRRLREDLTPRE